MMYALWENSLTAWLSRMLHGLYVSSCTCALFRSIANAFKRSRLAYNFHRALTAPQYTQTWYCLLLVMLGSLARCIGRVAERSLFAAALRALGRGVSRLTRGSFIARALARLGMRRLVLLFFALYLPLDVILRSAGLPEVVASTWDEAFLLFMLLYAFIDEARDGGMPKVTPIDGPFILFIGIGISLLYIVSPTLSVGVEGFRAVFQFMLYFFALVRLVKNEKDFNLVALTILGIGVFMAIHGIYQYIVATPIPSTWISESEVGVRSRAFSIVGSPNILGDFCVMTAPIAAAMAYKAGAMKKKLFFWGCFSAICLCCLVTFSRGAWIGLVVAAIVFSLMVDKRLLVLLFFAGLAALLVPEVSNRLAYLFTEEFQKKNTAGGRSMRWNYGMNLLNQKGPLLGVGLGRFGGAVAMRYQLWADVNYFYLDNYYVKTLVEMGYVGIISYVSLLLSSLWMGLRSFLRCPPDRSRLLPAALLAAVCGVLAHCFFENIFEVPYMNAYFWAFIALLACRGFLWRRKEKISG